MNAQAGDAARTVTSLPRSTDHGIPKAPHEVVVHQPGRLHQGIADRRADECEASAFQVFAERIGMFGAGGYFAGDCQWF